jgi:Tfp pilus assembly protein PilF
MIQTNIIKSLDNKNILIKKINVLKNDIEILSKSIKNNKNNKDKIESEFRTPIKAK